MRNHPLLYQIHTWVWLNGLSARYNHHITLENVPEEELDLIAAHHFDWVWLMGIWERSPRGREVARSHPGLLEEYRRALPDLNDSDIVGSPYAVHRYVVDARYGGPDALAAFRQRLAARGIRLMLDYVPNHVALDHPWTTERPEVFVQGTPDDLARDAGSFFEVGGRIFAHGRDPYFPAWTDTVQIDAFSPAAHQTTRETLLEIASQCDGVRCDMAMLLVSRVFAATWRRASQPEVEFWQTVIPPLKESHPNFKFVAEVYWDMEAELIAQGFDFTYDKRLYDRMLHESPQAVRDHLSASLSYQQHMLRFLENHDELRSAATFGKEKVRPAAVLALTLPGMKLIYEGQFEGRTIKPPVQLGRRPLEPRDEALAEFYRALMQEVNAPVYHEGTFFTLAPLPFPGGSNIDPLLCYGWSYSDERRVIAVNLSGEMVGGRIMYPDPELSEQQMWRVENVLGEGQMDIPSEVLLVSGIPVTLPPLSFAVYRLRAV
ncbi:MAG: alpha-amylase family glycosyl hydrolase [Anaerolineae bacterium]